MVAFLGLDLNNPVGILGYQLIVIYHGCLSHISYWVVLVTQRAVGYCNGRLTRPWGDIKQVDPTPTSTSECLERFCTLDVKSDTVGID